MSTDNKLRLLEGKKAFIYKRLTQYEMASKNTRLIYTDETNLNIYRNLPEKDFKEFMMAYLTYKKGDNIDDMFTSLTAKLLFMAYVSKIEYNEDKWEKQAKANQENGKKGGRPKKADITPNTDFENEAPNEVPNKIPSVQFEEIQKEKGFQKDFEDAVNQVIEIAAKQEQSLFSDVLQDLSSKLSAQYNKEYDSIKKLLYETAKAKCKRNKDLKETA